MLKSCMPSNCGSRLQEVGGDVGTSIQLQDFFSTDWGMPPIHRCQLYVTVCINLHQEAMFEVEMEASNGKGRIVGHIFKTRRVTSFSNEVVFCILIDKLVQFNSVVN